MRQPLTVAIIGAGICGLVAAKECLEEGLLPTVYEARDGVGGQWLYEEPDPKTGQTHSSVYNGIVYNGIVSNTCAQRSQFSDFPMDPARYPEYPTHQDWLKYILEYSGHFGLEKHVLLNTQVLFCDKRGDKWMVATNRGTDIYDALIVCTGKESIPYVPDINGLERFQGYVIHSHTYREPVPYANKRVAVVGFGSSAADIAVEVSEHAESCHLISRRGGWVLPRYVNGRAVEALQNRVSEYLFPRSTLMWAFEQIHHAVMGETPESLKPDCGILEANAVISNHLLDHVRSGRVIAHRASIEQFSGTEIILSNKEVLQVDAVILCTGYSITIPVVSEEIYRGGKLETDTTAAVSVDARRECSTDTNAVRLRLYRQICPPKHENIFFLGLVHFLGPLNPTVELQARWAVAAITRRISLPSEESMERDIDKFHEKQSSLFVNSRRHEVTVPALRYMELLAADLGIMPTWKKLSRKYLCSNAPMRGASIISYYYRGMITATPYRLFGHGRKTILAEATILRMAKNAKKMSEMEQILLTVDRPLWDADIV